MPTPARTAESDPSRFSRPCGTNELPDISETQHRRCDAMPAISLGHRPQKPKGIWEGLKARSILLALGNEARRDD